MSNGASKSSGSKPSGFKKQGNGAAKTVTVKPGDPSVQLKNLQQAAAESRGAKPKAAKFVQTTPKNPGKQQLDNLKLLGSSTVVSGDNPYK